MSCAGASTTAWLALAGLALSACGSVPAEPARARDLLAQVAEAYRGVPALEDEIGLFVVRGGREVFRGSTSYTLGPGGGVRLRAEGWSALAVGGRLYVTRDGVDDRYLEGAYRGDLRQALAALLGGAAAPRVPMPVALREGAGPELLLEGWRFGGLGRLRPAGVSGVEGESGALLDAVRFEADDGSLEARVDRETHLVRELRILAVSADGGEPFEARLRFAPRVLDPAPPLRFDARERRAVATAAELEPAALSLGAAVPQLVLEALGGGRVALAKQRDAVLVLDLWASWCAPCWFNLPRLQLFAERSRAAGLAVEVYTVNTAERFADPAERRAAIERAWQLHGLSLPVLLDVGDEAYRAFGSPALPSLFVIDRQGRVARHLAGLDLDLDQTLERELAALSVAR